MWLCESDYHWPKSINDPSKIREDNYSVQNATRTSFRCQYTEEVSLNNTQRGIGHLIEFTKLQENFKEVLPQLDPSLLIIL